MKTEVIFSLFVGIAVSLGGAFYYVEVYDGLAQCACSKGSGQKSKMKQLGTTVAMYFYEQTDQNYPESPQDLNFDPILVENSPHKTWASLNLKSQYYFFAYQGKKYTGNSDQPLAITKDKIKDLDKHFVVWEDGHVSALDEKETQDLIGSFVVQKILADMK